jgi:hypothetical protein
MGAESVVLGDKLVAESGEEHEPLSAEMGCSDSLFSGF